jgi:hypothetical protein
MSGVMPWWKRYFHDLVAAEISSMTRYYDAVVQWARVEGDTGYLLSRVEAGAVSAVANDEALPDLTDDRRRVAVLLNGTFNHHLDVEELLRAMHPKLARTSRLVIVAFNPYLQWLYRIAVALNLKAGGMPTTFLTVTDFDNLCRLSGYQRVRMRPTGYVPWRLLGLGSLVNRLMPAIPLFRLLSIATVIVLRPLIDDNARASVSVIIPARNERGNIEPAVRRLPDLGSEVEIVFVEGHSSDGTWEEIVRVRDAYAATHRIVALQQSGKGKADAVRIGFARATGDLLTILDADLTMPPELLPRFVDAYRNGVADFINGNRIVYPMEGGAMRFLNRLGNVFFAKALTWILGVRFGDCLCGTKLVRRDDYGRMVAWRRDFGDFDPFGDFELLFPAATLGIGLVDVPIRYRARTYGSTQISWFRHGFMLLKMTLIGFFRVKLGRVPRAS